MLCGKFNKANTRNRWTLDAGFGRVTSDSWGSNLLTDLTSFATTRQSASMVGGDGCFKAWAACLSVLAT